MKNKKIFNLIGIAVACLLLGVGIWKFNDKFDISLDNDKLISCKEHIDNDGDLLCDLCHSEIPFSEYAENKSIEDVFDTEESGKVESKVLVTGYMPKNSSLEANKLDNDMAFSTAMKYKSDISKEDVVAGFDISINSGNLKYQPEEYSQKVEVKISNLNLDLGKNYALLHIISENDFEILPVNNITENELTFTTGSFSTYIVITVGTYEVTFDGENFKVLDMNGDEITNGATITAGTKFSFNIVPNDGWGVTDIVCNLSSGDSAISSYGSIKGKNCYIASVSEALTVNVTTVIAPSVTVQPTSAKALQSGTASFSVTANNATSYEWQYRENKNELWKKADDLDSSYSKSTFSFTALSSHSGYEFRCLVGNANFTDHERVKSDIVTISVAQGQIKVGETPIIMVQPNMDKGKVKVNTGSASYSITALGGTDLTFTWQYRENENELWKSGSTVGSSSKGTYNSTTHLQTSTFTTNIATYQMNGYQFRCLVGNSFYFDHDAVKSDIVVISVADDDISIKADVLDLGITAQPESQKVKLGENVTFSITAVHNKSTYRWQYMLSGESFWSDVTSSMSSTYNKASMTIGTSTMSVDENLQLVNSLSGAKFRCIVTDESVSDYTKISDIAVLSVAQDAISEKVKVIVSVANVDYSIPNEAYVYSGTAHTPVVTLKNNGIELSLDTDYTVTYSNNINAGTAIITITGIGDYTGTRTENFTISAKGVDVIWQGNSPIVYDGVPHTLTASASGVNGETIMLSVTGAGTDVGTHKLTTVISSVTGGQARVGNYSLSNATKTLTINQRPITFTAGDESKTYDGTALTWENLSPGYTVGGSGLVSGHIAEVTRSGSVTNAGTAPHTIESVVIKNGTTDVTKNYLVTKESGLLTVNAESGVTFGVSVTGTSEFAYDGTAHEPTVSVTAKGKTLTVGTDYTLKYENNINASENAKVIVTGAGNYEGSNGSTTFKINKKKITIKAKSMEKVYDGALLKYSDISEPRYTVEPENGIVSRDTLNVVTNGQILNVGEEAHEIQSYSIMAGGIDSTVNYDVTLVNGTLKIKMAEISGNVIIEGTIETNSKLKANVSVVPDDCAVSYQWWYENENGEKINIDGATSKTLKVKDEELIGKVIGVTVTFTRRNYNQLSVSTKTQTMVVVGKNKDILMEREDEVYIIGAKRAKEQTNDNEYLSYTSDLVKEIKIVNIDTVPDDSWDISVTYGDESVMAWLSSDTLYIGCDGIIDVSSGTNLFANYTNCTSITGLENLDTSNVTDMTNMFADCSSLSSLETENLSTNACSSMSNMFTNCKSLTSLDVSGFKTIRTTNMSGMFEGCVGLKNIDVTNFRTVNVTDMSSMFKNCSALTSLDVSEFNTSRVTNFASMFSGCSGLTSIMLENFTTAKANSLETMFDSCSNLETLVLGKNFSKIDGTNMFRNCTSLKRIIAKSENAMALSADTGIDALTNAKIYVEKKENLSKYTSATNYGTLYEAGKVRAMLEIIGDNPASVTYGATYEDEGATVAGWTENESYEYEKLGYTLTTTGLPVNTNQVGKHYVIYTLKYSNNIVDTVTD